MRSNPPLTLDGWLFLVLRTSSWFRPAQLQTLGLATESVSGLPDRFLFSVRISILSPSLFVGTNVVWLSCRILLLSLLPHAGRLYYCPFLHPLYYRSVLLATMPSLEEPKNEARLLLVSNRLPITIKRSEDGKYDFSMSSGGLVSGLSGLSKSTTFLWYGWPGLEVPEAEIPVVKQRLKEEYGAVPVFIDDELADRHYNGFSSKLRRTTISSVA